MILVTSGPAKEEKMPITTNQSLRTSRVLVNRSIRVRARATASLKKIEKLQRSLQKYKLENQKLHQEVTHVIETYLDKGNLNPKEIQHCLALQKLESEALHKMLMSLIDTHTKMHNEIHELARQIRY